MLRQDDHHVQINAMKTTPLYRQTLHQPLLHSSTKLMFLS